MERLAQIVEEINAIGSNELSIIELLRLYLLDIDSREGDDRPNPYTFVGRHSLTESKTIRTVGCNTQCNNVTL